jgi:hypothetical protein
MSYRKNHSVPALAPSPDEIFDVLLACPPDDDLTHGKLRIFGVGGGSEKSKRLRREVESLCRRSISQEAIVNSVLDKVVEIYHPAQATVRGDFDSGEGPYVSIEAAYTDSSRLAIERSHLQWKRG